MDLKQWIVFIYCLPMELLTAGVLLGTFAMAFVLHRHQSCRWVRPGLRGALGLWIGAVLLATVLGREPSVFQTPSLIPLHSYREVLAGGNRELLRTNFMNVLLFYPGGVLCRSLLYKKRRGGICAVLLLWGASLALELCQYRFGLGKPEIDDVIHNALGALLGWLAFRGFWNAADGWSKPVKARGK
ncbi:MAG: VanZ family protein [Oscillospiraceae bacterium]|nr:VanZ family protein [Oscillospiraceae bacterium]